MLVKPKFWSWIPERLHYIFGKGRGGSVQRPLGISSKIEGRGVPNRRIKTSKPSSLCRSIWLVVGAERPWSDLVLIAVVGSETEDCVEILQLIDQATAQKPLAVALRIWPKQICYTCIVLLWTFCMTRQQQQKRQQQQQYSSMKDKMDRQQCSNVTLSFLLVLSLIFCILVFDWSDLMKNGRWRLGHQLCPRQSIEGKFGRETRPSGGKNLRRWRRSIKTITSWENISLQVLITAKMGNRYHWNFRKL